MNGETQLLGTYLHSRLYMSNHSCCTCFESCLRGHDELNHKSMPILNSYSYVDNMTVRLSHDCQNMWTIRESWCAIWLSSPEGAENTTTFKEDLIQQTWRNGTGAQNLLHLLQLVRKATSYAQRTSNCCGFGMGCTYHSQILSVEDFTTRPS